MAEQVTVREIRTMPKTDVRLWLFGGGYLSSYAIGILVGFFILHPILLYLRPHEASEPLAIFLIRDIALPILLGLIVRIPIWVLLTPQGSEIAEGKRGVVKLIGAPHPRLEVGNGRFCMIRGWIEVREVNTRPQPFTIEAQNIMAADGLTIESLLIKGQVVVIDAFLFIKAENVETSFKNAVASALRAHITGGENAAGLPSGLKVTEVEAQKTNIKKKIEEFCGSELSPIGIRVTGVYLDKITLSSAATEAIARETIERAQSAGTKIKGDALVSTFTKARDAGLDQDGAKQLALVAAGHDVQFIAIDGQSGNPFLGAAAMLSLKDKQS